jgi:cytochrome c oxidase assembly factor CtaG
MRFIFLLSGVLALTAYLLLPVPVFGAKNIFVQHMIRHTAMLLVIAPLFVLGIPSIPRWKKNITSISVCLFRRPLPAWIIGIGTMWIWHVPSIFNSMSMTMTGGRSSGVMGMLSFLHPFSLLIGGMLFCWPVIAPDGKYRLPPLKAVLYLAGACVFCSLLGLLITFAPPGTYRGVNRYDQQTGGLIMWVPCCFIYLSASMYLLLTWLSVKEEAPILPAINQ